MVDRFILLCDEVEEWWSKIFNWIHTSISIREWMRFILGTISLTCVFCSLWVNFVESSYWVFKEMFMELNKHSTEFLKIILGKNYQKKKFFFTRIYQWTVYVKQKGNSEIIKAADDKFQCLTVNFFTLYTWTHKHITDRLRNECVIYSYKYTNTYFYLQSCLTYIFTCTVMHVYLHKDTRCLVVILL